jgi:hypothetical protein
LGFFHFLKIVTGWSEDPSRAWLVLFYTTEDPSLLLKTGFFKQVRELKIQRSFESK